MDEFELERGEGNYKLIFKGRKFKTASASSSDSMPVSHFKPTGGHPGPGRPRGDSNGGGSAQSGGGGEQSGGGDQSSSGDSGGEHNGVGDGVDDRTALEWLRACRRPDIVAALRGAGFGQRESSPTAASTVTPHMCTQVQRLMVARARTRSIGPPRVPGTLALQALSDDFAVYHADVSSTTESQTCRRAPSPSSRRRSHETQRTREPTATSGCGRRTRSSWACSKPVLLC